jgi:hypothetical protein
MVTPSLVAFAYMLHVPLLVSAMNNGRPCPSIASSSCGEMQCRPSSPGFGSYSPTRWLSNASSEWVCSPQAEQWYVHVVRAVVTMPPGLAEHACFEPREAFVDRVKLRLKLEWVF